MNGVSKPGDYPLLSLRGREFFRLSPKAVETFWIVHCGQCDAPVRTNSLIVSEPSDQRLVHEGLHRHVGQPPDISILIHEHAKPFCQACYALWLNPKALEEAHDEQS